MPSAPSPPGDLTVLTRALQSAPSLLGFATVLGGKNQLKDGASPPRIVMFVVGARDRAPYDAKTAVSSAWMIITAHFWAAASTTDPGGLNNAFDLRERWYQALFAQAASGGYYWKNAEGENERWDQEPETAEQGQEFEIDIEVCVDANKPKQKTGTVEQTSLNRVFELTAALEIGDAAASVESTFELPGAGVLHIDDEQISYTATTPTRYTGLTRGINGTTAAAHASGTPVYVSIS